MGIGSDAPDQLRDLSVTLKIGMNPVQCAIGVRVATIMRRLGVHDKYLEKMMIRNLSA
jgi:hypothetical protein